MADADTHDPHEPASGDPHQVGSTREGPGVTNLPSAAAALLGHARASRAGRAGQTLTPGAGSPLKQTLLALAAGHSLAEHESPSAATLQVVIGAVRLTSAAGRVDLREGDHTMLPAVRHGIDAVDDAVMLLTVTQESRPSGHA